MSKLFEEALFVMGKWYRVREIGQTWARGTAAHIAHLQSTCMVRNEIPLERFRLSKSPLGHFKDIVEQGARGG